MEAASPYQMFEKRPVIALDIGFGYVKTAYLGYDDILVSKFETAVAPAQTGVVEFSSDEKEYTYRGRKYILGERARQRAIPTRSLQFIEQYGPLLAYKAVKAQNITSGKIAVGLPLGYFDPEHRQMLQEALSRLEVDGETLEFEVEVYAQGVGCLLDYRLDDLGNVNQGTKLDGLVIDIGYNTVDVVSFVGGKAHKDDSAMLERQGVSVMAAELMSLVQRKTRVNLSEQEAVQALSDRFVVAYGTHVDLSAETAAVAENYIERLLFTIQSRWEDRIQRANQLIIAGGGSYYINGCLPEQYRSLVHIPAQAEFSNARGYLKCAISNERRR